jgi:hypothetical protein
MVSLRDSNHRHQKTHLTPKKVAKGAQNLYISSKIVQDPSRMLTMSSSIIIISSTYSKRRIMPTSYLRIKVQNHKS